MAENSFPFHKNSFTVRVAEEDMAMRYGFHRRGHFEPVTPTQGQIAEHARAVELKAEVEANEYLQFGDYDYEFEVIPLTTERWVFDETSDEWMERWRAHRAANPDEKPPGSWLDRLLLDSIFRTSPILGLLDDTK